MSVGREGQGSWFFWIAFASLVLAVLGVIGAEIYSIEYRQQHRYDNLTLAKLSAKAHLRFPPSSRMVEYHAVGGWGNHSIFAKIEMDRRDVDGFVRSVKSRPQYGASWAENIISRKDRLLTTKKYWGSAPEWWRTDSPRQFIAARLSNYGVVDLLVDLDRQDMAVLYLHLAH